MSYSSTYCKTKEVSEQVLSRLRGYKQHQQEAHILLSLWLCQHIPVLQMGHRVVHIVCRRNGMVLLKG